MIELFRLKSSNLADVCYFLATDGRTRLSSSLFLYFIDLIITSNCICLPLN